MSSGCCRTGIGNNVGPDTDDVGEKTEERRARSRDRTESAPSEGKPYLLIIALSSGKWKTRGLGLPGCGLGVTLPISTHENPKLNKPLKKFCLTSDVNSSTFPHHQ